MADCIHPIRCCTSCGIDKSTPYALYCNSCYRRKWAADHPEQEAQQRATRKQKLKDGAYTVWRYNITGEDYNRMAEAQGGRCAICGTTSPGGASKERWAVDHDHACCPGNSSCGGCVRGLLCSKCNWGLGMFQDNVRTLASAIRYLESFSVTA